MRSAPAFRFLVYFDDDQRSETYAEHVTRSPGCGVKLGNDAFEREYETTRRARDLDWGNPTLPGGQKRKSASPIRLSWGTGLKKRESQELVRLSPMTKTWPLQIPIGPKEQVFGLRRTHIFRSR